MKVTFYKLPNGRKEVIEMTKINQEDADWLTANNVGVSMEEIGDQVVVYGDIGKETEEGEPDEIIVLSGSMNCYQTMAALRKQCQEELSK